MNNGRDAMLAIALATVHRLTSPIPRPNVIECDRGYSVEVLGPTGLRYMENGNVLFLDSEMLAGPAGIILFTQGGALTNLVPEEKQRIVENVRAAFKFRGFDIQIV